MHIVAPVRTTPPCPYFGSCGGCQWQHITYDAQVAFKQEILGSQLRRLAGIAEPGRYLRPPIASPTDFSYRNTSHFAIDPCDPQNRLFQADSHSIIPVKECPSRIRASTGAYLS